MLENEKEDVCYRQPTSLPERVAIARDFVSRFEYPIPLVVDPIENPAEEAYAAWPERFYVIDESGTVVFKSAVGPEGFKPDELEAWLAERFSSTESLSSR